jgi:hypothetical protein
MNPVRNRGRAYTPYFMNSGVINTNYVGQDCSSAYL